MAKQRFFEGIPLVSNLYADSRKRPGCWRYRWQDGSTQSFKAKTVQEANAFAIEANQVREQRPQEEAPENALPYWAEKYIAHRESIDPKLTVKSSWRGRNRAAIRQFAKQFAGTPVFQLSLKHIRPWWDSLTGNAQRNKKPELNRFCNHLIAEEVTTNLQPHPFNILMMRSAEPKTRVRMSLDDYWTIYQAAPAAGLKYIQDAMALALLTFMRRGDLCALKFDEHTTPDSLFKLISKANAQGKPKRLTWKFEHWPELHRVIARCSGRASANHNCPFLLSRPVDRRIMGDVKAHFNQVLPNQLSNDFATVRDSTGLYVGLDASVRPGLHEIRALGSHLYSSAPNQTAVMQAMAHSEIEMTRHYQSGHRVEDIEIGIEELSQELLGGEF